MDFKDKTVFLDTAPLIYFIEAKQPWFEKLLPIFQQNADGEFEFCTSVLTLEEVLVAPIRQNQTDLAKTYESAILNAPYFNVFDMDKNVARKAAEIRANYKIKTPDAIQLATAILHQADYFLTNDKQLKQVTELNILTLDDL